MEQIEKNPQAYPAPRQTPDGGLPKIFNPKDWIPARRENVSSSKKK